MVGAGQGTLLRRKTINPSRAGKGALGSTVIFPSRLEVMAISEKAARHRHAVAVAHALEEFVLSPYIFKFPVGVGGAAQTSGQAV